MNAKTGACYVHTCSLALHGDIIGSRAKYVGQRLTVYRDSTDDRVERGYLGCAG